jgi:WD40 repeat protein
VQLLEKHVPQSNQADLRGFEWRYLWQLSQGDYHTSLPTQEGSIQSLAFSPKGEMLATAQRDHTKVWSLTTRTPVADLPGAFLVAFSPDGESLYTGGPAGVR